MAIRSSISPKEADTPLFRSKYSSSLTSHLIHSTAFLSSGGVDISELQAISMDRPRETNCTPAGVGGGRLVISSESRATSWSDSFMPAMPRSAVYSRSSAHDLTTASSRGSSELMMVTSSPRRPSRASLYAVRASSLFLFFCPLRTKKEIHDLI